MIVTQLRLNNVRCFTDITFQWNSPWTIVIGNNGVGKTTIAESLFYLAHGKSFRTHKTPELLSWGSNHFFMGAHLANGDMLGVGAARTPDGRIEKQAKINGAPIRRYQEILDRLRVIVLSADDGELLRGSPERRRAWYDTSISVERIEYRAAIRALKRVVEQRNALLQTRASVGESAVWDDELDRLSLIVRTFRTDWLNELLDRAQCMLREWGDGRIIGYKYQAAGIEIPRERELAAQRTLRGAHLDDVHITLDGYDMRLYGSRGQQKIIAILLKLAQTRGKDAPRLLVLDDIITDLDNKNLEHIIGTVQNSQQIICFLPHESPKIELIIKKNSVDYRLEQLIS